MHPQNDDYAAESSRRAAYEAAHPETDILYLGGFWQAILCRDRGMDIYTRFTLRELLDKLESLDG